MSVIRKSVEVTVKSLFSLCESGFRQLPDNITRHLLSTKRLSPLLFPIYITYIEKRLMEIPEKKDGISKL